MKKREHNIENERKFPDKQKAFGVND